VTICHKGKAAKSAQQAF